MFQHFPGLAPTPPGWLPQDHHGLINPYVDTGGIGYLFSPLNTSIRQHIESYTVVAISTSRVVSWCSYLSIFQG